MKINTIGIKDNMQHIAGIIIGLLFKCNYSKADRSTKWFSTVSANIASQGIKQIYFPLCNGLLITLQLTRDLIIPYNQTPFNQ